MSPTSQELTELYLAELQDAGKSPATLTVCETWLAGFVKRYAELSALTPAELTKYHQALQWEPGPRGKLYSENTVNQALGVVRAFLRWCVEQGHLKTDPAAHLKTRRVPPKERRSLSASQVRRLLSLPDVTKPSGLRDRAILGLLVELNPSLAALSRLNLGDFQADTGALLLRGRRRQVVGLKEGLVTDIERYLKHGRRGYARPGEKALFLNQAGGRLSSASLGQLVRRYRDLLG